MDKVDMILRLLGDLKLEQQYLRERLEAIQYSLELTKKQDTEEKELSIKKQKQLDLPMSFRDWRIARKKK
ncbi:hypothetical protein [Bacillus cereus]|uniref:Uncharacterized protein n=1 Tax=Bacillus cereus VD184 TaxID=1053242 RepID=A0A9W5R257_BACCE|nr:hypothetical protein [Bacillus cereus]EOQ04832.1 hypothetical protein IKC_06416 [Bacillus cereus VD184]